MSQRYTERAATDERNMVEIVFTVGSGGRPQDRNNMTR